MDQQIIFSTTEFDGEVRKLFEINPDEKFGRDKRRAL